jgi:hypothetical protein
MSSTAIERQGVEEQDKAQDEHDRVEELSARIVALQAQLATARADLRASELSATLQVEVLAAAHRERSALESKL